MPIAQMFEESLDIAGRPAASAKSTRRRPRGSGTVVRTRRHSNLRGISTGAVGADTVRIADAIPVPEPLSGMLPGGLHRGEVAALTTRQRDRHPDYLALALLAEALNAGLWCAVVGIPDLGLEALPAMLAHGCGPGSGHGRQAALDRLLLIPDPGGHWAEVLAVLADGVDLLMVRPATPVSTEIADHVDARLRPARSPETAFGAALLVLGGWPSARLSLRVTRADWTGLDGVGPTAGTGRLAGCRATVVAQGRATAGRPRAARLWLPDENGAVRALSDDPRAAAGGRPPSASA